MLRVLAISGSLKAKSSNTALLRAAQMLSPSGMRIEMFTGIGDLPHFNADLDADAPPAAIVAFRSKIMASDGLLISSPEYARGVPGTLKNALDWLVSCTEFSGKPVALFNASPRGGHAQASLRLTLETMSANLVDAAFITLPLLGAGMNADAIVADAQMAAKLSTALQEFFSAISRNGQGG